MTESIQSLLQALPSINQLKRLNNSLARLSTLAQEPSHLKEFEVAEFGGLIKVLETNDEESIKLGSLNLLVNLTEGSSKVRTQVRNANAIDPLVSLMKNQSNENYLQKTLIVSKNLSLDQEGRVVFRQLDGLKPIVEIAKGNSKWKSSSVLQKLATDVLTNLSKDEKNRMVLEQFGYGNSTSVNSASSTKKNTEIMKLLEEDDEDDTDGSNVNALIKSIRDNHQQTELNKRPNDGDSNGNEIREVRKKYEKLMETVTEEYEERENELHKEIEGLKKQLSNKYQNSMTPVVTTGSSDGDETDVKKLNRKLRMLEGENKELKEEVEEMKVIIESKVQLKRSFEEMQEEAAIRREKMNKERQEKYGTKVLARELESAKEDWERLSKDEAERREKEFSLKLTKIEKKLQEELRNVKELTTENSKLMEELDHLRNEKDANWSQIDKLLKKLEKLQKEKDHLQQQTVETQDRVKELEKGLDEEKTKFQVKIEEMETVKKEDIEKMKKEIEENTPKQEVLEMQQELQKLKIELEDWHQKFPGYDQLNPPPPPPPINMPKSSIYPGKNGAMSMADVLAQIKKGVKLRAAGANLKDIDFPVEVSIAEECANACGNLKKVGAWRNSMRRGEPICIEATVPDDKKSNSTAKKK